MFHAFYQRLNPQIQIIGTGGVGHDAFEHILCEQYGAGGNYPSQRGSWCFWPRTNELKAIMAEKKILSLEDFRGKLRYID